MIVLFTATGDRFPTFQLVMKWMERQTMSEGIWLIVDDSQNKMDIPFVIGGWKVIHMYPGACPKEQWGLASQASLYLKGADIIEMMKPELTIIIGDDDYYAPDYVEHLTTFPKELELIGNSDSILVNPKIGVRFCTNKKHSAMESTAFRGDRALDLFKKSNVEMLENLDSQQYADKRFWDKASEDGLLLNLHSFDNPINYKMLALKGHAHGRPGISRFHREEGHYKKLQVDAIIPMDDLKEIMEVWK